MDQVCSFPYVVYYYVLYPTHIQRYQLTKKKKNPDIKSCKVH